MKAALIIQLLWVELIAYVRHSPNILRVERIVFNLLAQLADVYPQVNNFVSVLRPPYGFQQLSVWNQLARVKHEVMKHLEFFWRQVDRTPKLLDPIFDKIQFELPMANRCNLLGIVNMTSPHG